MLTFVPQKGVTMRRIRIVAALAASVLLAAVLPAAPAFADTTSVVTLQLVSPSGTPLHLDGVTLAVNGDGIENEYVTDANGTALLGSFPAGITLGVMAFLPVGSPYINLQHRGIPTVAGTGSLTIKLIIPLGASISGTVRSTTGSRVSGAEVRLLTTAGSLHSTTTTDARGVYYFRGLGTSKYRVQFNARGTSAWLNQPAVTYGWQFWKSTSSWSGADSISVRQQSASYTATKKTGVNAKLLRGKALVASVITAPAGASVTIEGMGSVNQFTWVTSPAATDQAFTVRLNKGYYRIAVTGYDGTTAFWWTGSSTLASADHAAAKKFYFSGSKTLYVTIQLPAP
jgi:hypothetical protein